MKLCKSCRNRRNIPLTDMEINRWSCPRLQHELTVRSWKMGVLNFVEPLILNLALTVYAKPRLSQVNATGRNFGFVSHNDR